MFQVKLIAQEVLVEPCTYYPTRELAERAMLRIGNKIPALRGKMIVVGE